MNNIKKISFLLSGILGALLLLFMSWNKNMAFAVWAIPLLLIYSFRGYEKWVRTIPISILCIIVKIISIHGGWDIDLFMEVIFGVMVSLPLLLALYLDRYYYYKGSMLLSTFVFPITYTSLDFLLSYTSVGMTFSIPYTQSRELILIQASSILGSWFIGFMVALFASAANNLIKQIQDKKIMWKIPIIYISIIIFIISYGSFKQVFKSPSSNTVKIASITVPHTYDFWSITDEGTPKTDSYKYKEKMKPIADELFTLSKKAADFDAKIIFWSEGNLVMYEDEYALFIQKAASFAKENKVYFMPAILVLNYDSFKNDNKVVMIDPDGKIQFEYEKTKSWYPTYSDGVIKKVDTPYGRIGSAICFDMDFPGFIRQASDTDIMLIPAFDTQKISPFHTEVSLLRGVEYGFSVIRQCNKGTSIAADYNGNIISYQDYYSIDEKLMISDVPTKGITTLYEITGEWFAILNILCFIFILIYFFSKLKRR